MSNLSILESPQPYPVTVVSPVVEVLVQGDVATVITAGQQGLPGPPGGIGPIGITGGIGATGPPGAAGGVVTFVQNVASSVWTIVHNLGTVASVTVIDSTGRMVIGDVFYPDVNTAVVTFSAPFAGTAYVGS